MPSPFPGMDPWLEAPDIWPDLHDHLASAISATLNRQLPPPYYAVLASRLEIRVPDWDEFRPIKPDVPVKQPDVGDAGMANGGVAVLTNVRIEVSPAIELALPGDPERHHLVEVRDSARDHSLVTLIEICSPSNKRSGSDRQTYVDKQQEVLSSDASLVEIDLLRKGERVLGDEYVQHVIASLEPPRHYCVVVSRAWERAKRRYQQLFAWTVRDSIPCVAIPLREGESDLPLDLQHVFNLAWDSGPYRRGAVNYRRPPHPPFAAPDMDFLRELLAARGVRWDGES